jgi:hypothetical protein
MPLLATPGFNTRGSYPYMLCGWRTHSEIPLSCVPTSANDGGTVDVTIEIATGHSPIAKRADRIVFQHTTKHSLIAIKDVADFEIRGGRQIRVWPAAGATRKNVEIFLLGPAWATLCHQRGVLPLHASAIVTRTGITAFAGHSGTGKSTAAALLDLMGYELIADDILPVNFNQNSTPGAWPYLRRLKLSRDYIVRLGLTPGEIVSETLDTNRNFVLPKRTGNDKWRKLNRLYLLESHVTDSQSPIEQLTGAAAVRVLVDQTYHFNFVLGSRRLGDHLAFCARLASKIPIYCLRRLLLPEAGKKVGSVIREHLESTECNTRQNPPVESSLF